MQQHTNTAGLLVVKRTNFFKDERYKPVSRLPALDLSHEEVVKRYRGFDGEPWPQVIGLENISLRDGLASLQQQQAVVAYLTETKKKFSCDMLYLSLGAPPALISPPESFCFLGYDYGFYVSESNYFSALFHEVIYGLYPELRELSRLLNGQLLFSSLIDVQGLEEARERLLAAGGDLETDEEQFTAISIWGQSEVPPDHP